MPWAKQREDWDSFFAEWSRWLDRGQGGLTATNTRLSIESHLETSFSFLGCFIFREYTEWVIDQTWGQDDWILAKFFILACLWTEIGEVQKHANLRRTSPVSSYLDRTIFNCLVNTGIMLCGKENAVFVRDTVADPELARYYQMELKSV